MAKFYGAVGYATTVETEPGIWIDSIVEKNYYGDIIKRSERIQSSGQISDDIVTSSQISIISDPYADLNYPKMRYAIMSGIKWKITNVDVQYPRLVLTLGGLYND